MFKLIVTEFFFSYGIFKFMSKQAAFWKKKTYMNQGNIEIQPFIVILVFIKTTLTTWKNTGYVWGNWQKA